jgi:hypothetical protein
MNRLTKRHASSDAAPLPVGEAGRVMGIELLSDESVLRFYEISGNRSSADITTGNRYRFMGVRPNNGAERLRIEIDRRCLRCNPIEWRDFCIGASNP